MTLQTRYEEEEKRTEEDTEQSEAIGYMRELRKDPKKYAKWLDRVIEGWMMRKSKTKTKSPRRHSKNSKSH